MQTPDQAEHVLTFWLHPRPTTTAELEQRRQFWFTGSADLDREIGDRFGTLVAQARQGQLDAWTHTPRGALAWLILVDQFSRNLHRGTAAAFSHDPAALAVADTGFANGWFDDFDLFERMFAALPYRHAEDVEHQKRAVELAVHDALAAPPEFLDFAIYSVDWARKHLDVIVRYGRFPHRNAAVGRTSTEQERAYLAYLKRANQWL